MARSILYFIHINHFKQLSNFYGPGTVFKDPDKALRQCLSMVRDRCLTSRQGNRVAVEIDTICVHGDEPTAVALARHVRGGLEAAGCRIVAIPEMLD